MNAFSTLKAGAVRARVKVTRSDSRKLRVMLNEVMRMSMLRGVAVAGWLIGLLFTVQATAVSQDLAHADKLAEGNTRFGKTDAYSEAPSRGGQLGGPPKATRSKPT